LKILHNTKWQLRNSEVIWIVNYASTYYVYATTCMHTTILFIQIFYKVHFPMKFPREFTLEFVYTGL